MKRNDIEFEVGDKVVYKPYEQAFKAVILEVDNDGFMSWGVDDERIFYKIVYEVPRMKWGRRNESDFYEVESSSALIVDSKYYEPEKLYNK